MYSLRALLTTCQTKHLGSCLQQTQRTHEKHASVARNLVAGVRDVPVNGWCVRLVRIRDGH